VPAAKLVRAVTWVLHQQSTAAAPTSSVVCIKTRSQAVYSAELLKKGLPSAKSVFLYVAQHPSTRLLQWLLKGEHGDDPDRPC
jgi:hypothetical protein